ncbi:hypothetical protein AYI70_g4414 [Smittium culicis]|uniref:Uncharacterized protein n=1 Tax=Smittium culicis TaxID=133412 RepID=A0A1R1XZB5_9FUNG|nr:hypothetical protein AYI70_g4414 [Smittium culicis]
MGQNERDARLSIPRLYSDYGGKRRDVCSNHTLDILQALRACVQCQQREIVNLPIPVYHTPEHGHQSRKMTLKEDDVEMSREIYWESPVNVDRTAAGSPYASPTFRTKESIAVDSEIMEIDIHPEETCHSEPIVLEEQTDFMEQALILARDARIGNFHRFQRFSLGNSGGIPNVLRIMESKRGKNAHKRQGITDSTVRPQTQECGHLCTVGAQSRRCAEQTDCTNRMVSITGSIRNTEFSLWPARRRPVCIPPEQEGGSLLQLIPGHRVDRPECTSLQLVRVRQPIQLPAMESDLPSSSESPTRTSNNKSGDTNVKVCYLVSGPIGPVNLEVGPSSSNDDHIGSKKRKVAAL